GEVRIRLSKSQLGQMVHDLGTGKCLSEKNHFWILSFDISDQAFPEAKRLGMGIIDAKDTYVLVDPELRDAFQLLPERLPVFRLEVEGIDVLIFFRWVLGILNAAVRAVAKPFGMFPHIGMIGRALEREIQGNLDAVFFRLGDQAPEVL